MAEPEIYPVVYPFSSSHQDVRIKNSISNTGQVEFYTIGNIDISNYTVLDLQGNILSSNSLNSDKGIIDMSLLSNGMYIINFETNDAQVYTKKIVLSK